MTSEQHGLRAVLDELQGGAATGNGNGTGNGHAAPDSTPDHYGRPGHHAAVETSTAIERAVEAVIAEHFRAADNLDKMAKQVRANAESFATKLRAYSAGFSGHLADFLLYAQQAGDMAEKHSAEFEDKIKKMMYPRAGDGQPT